MTPDANQMKLYVCWGTFDIPLRGHPCHVAYEALRDAGYEPDVINSHGWGRLPDAFNRSEGRRIARELTGENWVPVLVLGDGEAVAGSRRIKTWAEEHPRG